MKAKNTNQPGAQWAAAYYNEGETMNATATRNAYNEYIEQTSGPVISFEVFRTQWNKWVNNQ